MELLSQLYAQYEQSSCENPVSLENVKVLSFMFPVNKIFSGHDVTAVYE
jgi:hypothetical protein